MVIIMIIDHGNGKIGDGFDYYVYCDGDDGQAQDGFFCEELDEEDFFSLLTFSFIFQVVSINCSVSANPFNDLVFR